MGQEPARVRSGMRGPASAAMPTAIRHATSRLAARALALSALFGGQGASENTDAGGTELVVIEDIQRRVARAGGNVEGVLVASLSWSTADDLDLHVLTPSGAEISYQNKRAAGGELDVDMCVQGRHGGVCKDRPVENVV